MNIIMMGAQGTGKGTVAGMLKERLNIPHISTGDIFRKNIKEGTELGKIAIQYADEGKLVPDEVTNKMVKNRINEEDCKNGFILDGYPRNIEQAKELERIMPEKGEKIDKVVYLNLPTEEIMKRILGRRECPKCKKIYNIYTNKPKNEKYCDNCEVELITRADDTEEKLQIRLDTFFNETMPVIDFYKEKGIVDEKNVNVSLEELENTIVKEIVEEFNK